AAGGVRTAPTAIRKVVLANGTVDTHAGESASHHTRVLPDGEAAVVTKILQENVQYGTGTGAALTRPVSGKTGTTTDNADAWFVGYIPQLTTAVWVGYPGGEVPMQNVHGIAVSGGSFPAEIWKAYMEQATAKLPVVNFPEPSKWPTWKPFHRGPFALSYDPYATTTTATTAVPTRTK